MAVLVFRVRSNRSRAQSPCSPGQYPPSPLRQRATTPGTDDRGHGEVKGHSTLERKSTKAETSEKKIPKSTSKELNAGKGTVCPSASDILYSGDNFSVKKSSFRSVWLHLNSPVWKRFHFHTDL